MNAKILDAEINKFLPLLSLDQKKSLLDVMRSLISRGKKETRHISIEQYNIETEEALGQVAAGNYISHEELEKEMEQW